MSGMEDSESEGISLIPTRDIKDDALFKNLSSDEELELEDAQLGGGQERDQHQNAPSKPPRSRSKEGIKPRLNFSTDDHALNEDIEKTKEMTLNEFVDRFSKKLPMEICIEAGYCGNTDRLTLSAQEHLNIHCIKRIKVVTVEVRRGFTFTVPINSALQFSLLYKSAENVKETNLNETTTVESGFTFESVSDLLALPVLPKVVCATKSWEGQDEKSSTIENEIFILAKQSKAFIWKKKCLKAYSVTAQMEKQLLEECACYFTTCPSLTRIYLSDFVSHTIHENVFPCEALINLSAQLSEQPILQSFLPQLASNKVKLLNLVTETTLVASPIVPGTDTTNVLFDLPVELPEARISAIVVSDTRRKRELFESTLEILEDFNPQRLMSFRDSSSPKDYDVQSLFYTMVRKGHEGCGVDLDVSLAVYGDDNEKKRRKHSSRAKYQKLQQSVENLVLAEANGVSTDECVGGANEEKPGAVSKPVDSKTTADTDTTTEATKASTSADFDSMKAEIGMLTQSMWHITQQLDSLKQASDATVAAFSSSSGMAGGSACKESDEQPTAVQENLTYLKSLDIEKVCELLQGMGLQQYQEAFSREHISGDVLIELVPDTLEKELGVASHIHRIRLMKVIDGSTSARQLLEQ